MCVSARHRRRAAGAAEPKIIPSSRERPLPLPLASTAIAVKRAAPVPAGGGWRATQCLGLLGWRGESWECGCWTQVFGIPKSLSQSGLTHWAPAPPLHPLPSRRLDKSPRGMLHGGGVLPQSASALGNLEARQRWSPIRDAKSYPGPRDTRQGAVSRWPGPPLPGLLHGCLILHRVLTLEGCRDYSLSSCLRVRSPVAPQ